MRRSQGAPGTTTRGRRCGFQDANARLLRELPLRTSRPKGGLDPSRKSDAFLGDCNVPLHSNGNGVRRR